MESAENTAGDKPGGSLQQTSRNVSVVWKYFTKDESSNSVTCKICKSVLKYNKNTSAMHMHLKRHPLMLAEEGQPKSHVQQSISAFTKRPAVTERRRQQITNLLVDFIVKDIRPLAAVHGDGFRDLLNFFEPGYNVPSYNTLWNAIAHQYDNLRENIGEEMKGQSVSLTTDLWTSSTMEPYITVTAHYVTDSWQLKARVLCTTMMPERDMAVNIADRLSKIISEWGIQVFCTVHDNASNMNLAMELCEMFPHDLGCTGHTLQLAVKAGLVLPEVVKAVDAARRVVSHFRHSSLASCALKQRQEQLGVKSNKLQTDCPVRWNSTFVMLQRLFEQRIAVQSVLADEAVTKSSVQKSLAMRASQWELVEQLIPVLQPLAKATEIMCGELHVGLSFIYPVIFNMISNTLCVEESDLAAVRTFKNTVRQQLETRFKLRSEDLTESIPIVACMLDPRFKHLHFIPQNKREEAQRHLDVLLQNGEPPAATGEAQAEDTTDAQIEPMTGKKARLEEDFVQLLGPHYQSDRRSTHCSTAAEEIRDYFSTPHIPTMDNPLQWWSRNQDRFPRLAKLSKSYLAVPATSTPSERIFSLAGNTITRQRASLHPDHVDALIYLHANQDQKQMTKQTVGSE
ncbi:E3 SUMO-protein ligase ZBED1-like [Nothobranchius furzeri]|uniref:E3 SUMO-protein ligase ZBED1-like n=1 Tax=Nothobranchius furzeri TaxID=105023 RepID=UPI003904A9D6